LIVRLEEAFREKALVDRDFASGVLHVKVVEKRATLLGQIPARHTVAMIHQGMAPSVLVNVPMELPMSQSFDEADRVVIAYCLNVTPSDARRSAAQRE
jgi:hypothetical protein